MLQWPEDHTACYVHGQAAAFVSKQDLMQTEGICASKQLRLHAANGLMLFV